ncbi:MFS transporter [Actinomadura madurae]|uniref:MFS transporter n=1 Tax=Actinomadura madurae TaxID=1993 RepID=UPI0020D23A04|nr:MFS transporter [Actinomadura madurae]MCP9982165.1 MFS transporter [Actinomadura madurae]
MDGTGTRAAEPAAERGTAPRFGAVFAIVAAGVAMSNLDVFIVNVALPQIGGDFAGASLASLSWILNAYAVVFAALLVPAGGLADRTGPKRAFLLGVAVFTLASAACAAAPGVWWLVAARVVQAAGAATLVPSSLGLLLAAAPAERRVAAVRGWTAIGGLAAALGPVAGGLLTQADWRWIFLVNVPAGAAALVAGARLLPGATARRDAGRPDLPGAALLTAGIAALALGVVKTEDWSGAEVTGTLLAAGALLAWFVLRSARHPSPVLPLGLLRTPAFGSASVANVLFAVAFAAMLLSCVLWCQDVWDWSALRTGLAITPGPLMVPALALGGAPLARRFGAGRVAAARLRGVRGRHRLVDVADGGRLRRRDAARHAADRRRGRGDAADPDRRGRVGAAPGGVLHRVGGRHDGAAGRHGHRRRRPDRRPRPGRGLPRRLAPDRPRHGRRRPRLPRHPPDVTAAPTAAGSSAKNRIVPTSARPPSGRTTWIGSRNSTTTFVCPATATESRPSRTRTMPVSL